jgi:hypothetical protein
MIQEKFNTRFDVLRQVWGVQIINGIDVDIATEQAVHTFYGYKQQATAEYAQYTGLTTTKGYSVWCPVQAQVYEGDTIVADGIAYQVRARQDYQDGTSPHAQLAVEMIGKEVDNES